MLKRKCITSYVDKLLTSTRKGLKTVVRRSFKTVPKFIDYDLLGTEFESRGYRLFFLEDEFIALRQKGNISILR